VKNSVQALLVGAASATVASAIVNANIAQAFSFSFAQVFESSGILTGDFSGSDANGNGSLEANEFTSFASLFVGDEAAFSTVRLGLESLVATSYFTAPDNFAFILTDVAADRGFQSFAFPGEVGETYVGFAPSAGIVSARYATPEPLVFVETPAEAIPEPATMAGLALAGLGMRQLRRRQQNAPSRTK
jgi:hypothetical protein